MSSDLTDTQMSKDDETRQKDEGKDEEERMSRKRKGKVRGQEKAE